MTDTANSRNADGIFEPFQVDDVPVESFAKGERFAIAYRHLSSFGGGRNRTMWRCSRRRAG